MKISFREHRSSKYQNRIFVLLLLMAAVPLLIAGAISYKIYMDEVTNQTDLSMEAIETQIYNDVEVVLSSIRQYYLENSSSDEIGLLIQTDSIPYREYSNLFDAQKLLKGPTYIDDYVGKYAFINLEKGWILTNNGMYRLLTVMCMLEGETNEESELETEALSMTVARKIPERIREQLICFPFSMNGQIFLVIGADTDEELQERTKEIHSSLTAFFEKEFGCSVISGVSQPFPRLKYLRTAYNECMETLRNTGRLHAAHSDITFYEDITRNDGSIGGYDFVIENSMMKAVNDGNGEEAAQLLDKFVNSLYNREIVSHDRSFSSTGWWYPCCLMQGFPPIRYLRSVRRMFFPS